MQKDRLLRIGQVLEILPVSRSFFWKQVANGKMPAPVKLGRTTCWRESQILDLVANGSDQEVA